MSGSTLLSFCLIAAVLTITPGADTMLVMRNVLRGGRRTGFATTFGICNGLFVHAILSAAGLSVILARSATAFHLVKLAGGLYLVWLGLQSCRAALKGRTDGLATGGGDTEKVPARASFVEGFTCNVLNPKVAVFYLALFPQFIAPGEPVFATSMMLAAIHYLMGIVCLGGLSIMLSHARHWIEKTNVRRCLDGLSGGILVLLGARLALERR